jgi:dTDP-4-dehydrorhamnose reductase
MKVLLLGATGQIGDAVQKLALTPEWPADWRLTAWSRADGDLSKPDELIKKIELERPDLIWNAAAYTQVDQAETERALAFTINAESPGLIARYCKRVRIPMIHYSTDYVYAGIGDEPHTENDVCAPRNEYGKSKLAGDIAIAASGCDYLIFRTSWVFSNHGKNFVKTMLKLSKERTELMVVSDQYGSPSYAPDLALHSLQAIRQALASKAKGETFCSGIYHLTNSGVTTWLEFAKAILPAFPVIGILTKHYSTPAVRPLNSRLSLSAIATRYKIAPRSWRQALNDCLSH